MQFNEQSAAERLYPSMAPTPQAQVTRTSIIGGSVIIGGSPSETVQRVQTANEKLIDQAREEGVPIGAISDEMLAEKFYSLDGLTHDAVNSYEPYGVQTYYDDLETKARGIKDEEQLAILAQARVATDAAFREYSVHPTRAQELMSLASSYTNSPKDQATIDQMNCSVETNLRAEFGRRTDSLLAGARRVAADLCKKIPEFEDLLNTGMGSEQKVVRTFINAAIRRGFCK